MRPFRFGWTTLPRRVLPATLGIVAAMLTLQSSRADEGGVSFWLPGQFGSLAAAPQQPGWSFASIYYHTSVNAGGNVAAARQVSIGRVSPTVNIDLNVQLKARPDLIFMNVNHVFATPVLGGQFALGMTGAFGRNPVSIDGTLTTTVGGFTTTRTGSINDERFGVADLYPMASLRWNRGVHNFMIYGTGDIPVGTYDSSRLSNVGIGHGAADGGFGYTYFNPHTGHEFSAVTGLTYNFRNDATNYQNGVNWHLDWGASQFLSPQLHIGAVGYVYEQLTADRGAPLILGDNKSGVMAVGPQIGFLFPVGSMQGYLNVKGYYEFNAHNRPEGWNAWLTFAISPAAVPQSAPVSRLVRK